MDAALDVVGGKWKVLIMWPLRDAPKRFGDERFFTFTRGDDHGQRGVFGLEPVHQIQAGVFGHPIVRDDTVKMFKPLRGELRLGFGDGGDGQNGAAIFLQADP